MSPQPYHLEDSEESKDIDSREVFDDGRNDTDGNDEAVKPIPPVHDEGLPPAGAAGMVIQVREV